MNERNVNDCIVMQNVTKIYTVESHEVPALKGVDLTIPRGSIVSVTGASGAGKSTFLHILGTLERPTRGRVLLNGVDVSNINDKLASSFRNKTIGFIFQMNNLLPDFSALENVMMPGLISGVAKDAVRKRAKELLSRVGLDERLQHRPGELSGGEQQRVAIARALLMAPPILLADEPTGNLDKKTSLAIQDLLMELAKEHNMTMLLITHDMTLADRLPHKIVLEDGLIKDKGDFV